MTTSHRFTSRVLEHRQLSAHGYELVLSREGLEFQPGRLATLHGRDITEDRSYSIASGRQDDFIAILYRMIPDGVLTPQLHRLRRGDEVDVSAPFGQFVLRDPEKPVVFIATGTGVAPCRSYVRSYPDLDLTLIMGVQHEEDLYYREEFEPHHFIPCVSREPSSNLPHRVTDVINAWEDSGYCHYYLCGAFSMIFDVHALLRDKGVEDSRIFTEEYYYQSDADD